LIITKFVLIIISDLFGSFDSKWRELPSKCKIVNNADTSVMNTHVNEVDNRIRRYCCRSRRFSGNGLNDFRNCVAAPNGSLEARARITGDNDAENTLRDRRYAFVAANDSIIDRSRVTYALEAAKQSSLFSPRSLARSWTGTSL